MSGEPARLTEPDDGPAGEPDLQLAEVRLLRIPLRLWARASAHVDELLREFSLLQIGAEQDGMHEVPRRLLDLVADLQARYAGVNDEPDVQRDAAMAAGLDSLDLVYRVSAETAQAVGDLIARLDEADEYCRSGDALITLASPADQIEFRRWYLEEFRRQIDGHPPTPWHGSLD